MGEIRVDVEFLRAKLFGGLNARIVGARFDGEHSIWLTLSGPDVPADCAEVVAIVTVRSECRACGAISSDWAD